MREDGIRGALLIAAVFGTVQVNPLRAQRADTIVRVVDRPAHAGLAAAVQEVSIGVADGDEHYMIGQVTDIAVGGKGEIYIYDRTVPAIRMYDASGKFVRIIGRKGRGPGEYQSGSALAVAPNGNLLMWDPGNARINVYSATGEIVAHWPTLSGTSSESAFGKNLLTVDHTGVVNISRTAFSRNPQNPGEPHTRQLWIRYTANGSLKDTLSAPPMPENRAQMSASRGGASMSVQVPFTPAPHVALSPAGAFVTGLSDRYAFEIVEPGKPVVSVRRNVPPKRTTKAERDAMRDHVNQQMHNLDPSWSWNGPDIPDTKPAYTDIRTALDGRIWVTVAQGPRPDSADSPNMPTASIGAGHPRGASNGGYSCNAAPATTYDVFEPTGSFVGTVQLPERSAAILMKGDLVWASACDEDGVPSVKRFRINWR